MTRQPVSIFNIHHRDLLEDFYSYSPNAENNALQIIVQQCSKIRRTKYYKGSWNNHGNNTPDSLNMGNIFGVWTYSNSRLPQRHNNPRRQHSHDIDGIPLISIKSNLHETVSDSILLDFLFTLDRSAI